MRGAILTLALVAGIGAAQAQQQTSPKRAAAAEAQLLSGAYEVSNEAGTRKCILLLRPTDAPGGYAAGFPAQCRMAIPPLAKVSSWTVELTHQAPRARIVLLDAAAAPQLDFREEGPNGAGLARDNARQIYHIRPTHGATLAQRADSLVGARPAPRIVFTPPPPDTQAMSRATGVYALLRAEDKDTGCRLRLDGASPASVDGAAVLVQKCEDKGIAFFGPKGWNIAGETLWLIGSRGRIGFERNRKGGWSKAPGQGEPLNLTRQ